jgi:hypothetical protein
MFTDYDPDHTDAVALDDRNADFDPDFEIDERLAFHNGWGLSDPADL